MAPDDEVVTEYNWYRSDLVQAKTTVINCGDAVYSGYGSPLDAIANPLGSGGWECTEADDWITEMQGQCAGITQAFDDAATAIQQAISGEPERVPEGNWRGRAYRNI